jgi:hypothetical protein
MLPFLKVGLCLAMLGLLLGCGTTYKVSADYDKQIPFDTYRTYTLLQMTEEQIQETGIRDPRLVDHIAQQVKYQMDRRGYREVPQNGDLEIGYFAISRTQTVGREVGGVNVGIGFGGYYGGVGMSSRVGGRIEYSTYVNGTLVIEMYHPETKGLIWHGAAEATLELGRDNPYKVVESAVRQIFSKYKFSVPKKERM